jgi:hypothetical protein
MRIFFYDDNDQIRRVHAGYELHRLAPYLSYFEDIRQSLWDFRTENPETADFFFVPINLISFQFADRERRFADPGPYIRSLQHLGRKPHLVFAAGDFGQRSRASYETTVSYRPYPEVYPWLDHRFVLLAFESTDSLDPQDIALFPYVLDPLSLYERCLRYWIRLQCTERDLLFSFSGGISYKELSPEHIRGQQLRKIEGISLDSFVGSAKTARETYGAWRGSDIGIISRSTFTLCPAGMGRWSFRLIQAIVYGSIPVLLSDGYIKPMSRYLDWNRICLTLPESEVTRVPKLLRKMPVEQIAEYQRNLSLVAHRFSKSALLEMLRMELRARIPDICL